LTIGFNGVGTTVLGIATEGSLFDIGYTTVGWLLVVVKTLGCCADISIFLL
jgi:hypothetical protein